MYVGDGDGDSDSRVARRYVCMYVGFRRICMPLLVVQAFVVLAPVDSLWFRAFVVLAPVDSVCVYLC